MSVGHVLLEEKLYKKGVEDQLYAFNLKFWILAVQDGY